MRIGLRSIGAAISQTSRHWGTLAVANLIAAALSLPLLLIVAFVTLAIHSATGVALIVILVIGVLPNPGAAGLQFLACELANRDVIYFSDQWEGLRHFGWLAVRAWLLSLAGTVVIVGNVVFYGRFALPLAPVVQIVWLYVLLVWLCLHLYIYPLIMTQQDKRVRLIYRNAFVMSARRPLVTLLAAAVWLLVLLLATGTGLAIIIGLALAASIQQNITAAALTAFVREEE